MIDATEDPPVKRVLSLEEFEAAQHVPAKSLRAVGDSGLSRILSPDEFEHAQTLNGPAAKQWKIPALPVIAPRDATSTGIDRAKDKKGTKIDGVVGAILRQAVNPVLENPIQTAAIGTASAVPGLGVAVGAVMGGMMVHNIASYGWQKAAEMSLPDDVRKIAEADPERISGEAAAVQAAMLGLAPLIHVGLKSVRGPGYGEGMFEGAGRAVTDAAGAGQQNITRFGFSEVTPETEIRANPRGVEARKNASFASALEARAAQAEFAHTGNPPPRPPGFEPTVATTARAGAGAKPIEGLVVPETVKPGKVAAIDTVDPSAPLAEHADVANRLAELRRQDAERASRIRRRPKGEKQPFFETEQGAQTLGATAARHGVDAEANPYHGESPLAASWNEGHAAATESFPEGFSMGGALTDNRIPADYKVPRVPGFEPHIADVPEGVTPETIALADALRPSRFRGHSESDLIAAAVDAQERLEKAQMAESRNGEGAAGFSEHLRGDNTFTDQAVGGNPFYAKTVERELIRAKSQLTQIEREATLRGLTGDELATRINDEKAARAERLGQAQEDALSFAFGDDPAESAAAGDRIVAVEGTGGTRVREIARSVLQRAAANGIEGVDEPGMHTRQAVTHADQAARAAQILHDDPALARRIAFGEVNPPEGLVPDYVFIALENKAIAEGDVSLINELAARNDATYAGQRIAAYATRDPDSPVGAIKKVLDVRMGGAKDVPKATAETVASLRKQLSGMKLTREQWASFVDSLKC